MSAVWMNSWLETVLGAALKSGGRPSNVIYHWYTNDYTPDADSDIMDFDEASGGDISTLTVAAADWTVSAAAGSGVAEAPEEELSVAGALTLYGYYVTDDMSLTIPIWAERFEGGPLVWPAGGGALLFTPRTELLTPIS